MSFRRPPSEVAQFCEAMGLNRKQFAQAADAIGMNPRQLNSRSTGVVPISKTDRLAMMAALCGLPEFSGSMADISPEQWDVIRVTGKLLRALIEGKTDDIPEPMPGE